jgi:hypothetical protein
MGGRSLWSIQEIGRSIADLFRGIVGAVWLVLGVGIPGALAIIKDAEPEAELKLSAARWGEIALGAAAVSIAAAYHRTRLERDEARAGDVERGHGEDLRARIGVHIERIEHREPCIYDGAPGTGADRASFEAHHRELAEAADRWNVARDQTALRTKLHEELRRATGNLDTEIWNVEAVFDQIWAWLIGRAEHDELDAGPGLAWGHEPAVVECRIKLSDRQVGSIPETPHDTRGDRLREAKKPVDDIAQAALGWPVTSEITAFVEASEDLRQPLLDIFSIESQVERVRATRLCAICRKNQGWPEPKPSVWQRVVGQLGRARARIRSRT